MEQQQLDLGLALYQKFGFWAYGIIILITGILSSVAGELLYKYTTENSWTRKHNLVIFCNILLTISTMMVAHSLYPTWSTRFGCFVGNLLISLLFYLTLGKQFLPKIIITIQTIIPKVLNKGTKEVEKRLDDPSDKV